MRGVFVSFFLFGRGLIVGEVGVPRFLFVVIGQGGLLDSCQKIYHFLRERPYQGEEEWG